MKLFREAFLQSKQDSNFNVCENLRRFSFILALLAYCMQYAVYIAVFSNLESIFVYIVCNMYYTIFFTLFYILYCFYCIVF